MCFCNCSILVHRVEGVITEIKGNPKSSYNAEGAVCGKSHGGIMLHYDPNRVTKPMKRTNPKKGLDEDPGWVEITWDEALDTIAAKMMAVDTKEIAMGLSVASIVGGLNNMLFFGGTLHTQNVVISDICGAAIHLASDLCNAAANACPDYKYNKYLIQFGMQAGTATRHGFTMIAPRMAEARANGAKLVAVDPHMSASAEKAEHWLPIRPGTDAALALAMANILVNEIEVYDRDFLKNRTNSPYLVDLSTGKLLRDKQTGSPLIWDSADNKAKVFNDESIQDFALLGEYQVDGVDTKTAFQILKEHLKTYTPDYAEKITTIPAARIRLVAREFAEAASIGSTITIDGKVIPYRPAAADTFSGVSRHKHALLSHLSVFLLNTLVGSQNVCGGMIGYAPRALGAPETGGFAWEPGINSDGYLEYVNSLLPGIPPSHYEKARMPIEDPNGLGMMHLMPLNKSEQHFIYYNQLHPEEYGRDYKLKVFYNYAGNNLKNWGNNDHMAQWFRSIDFVVSVDIYLNDSSYFADIFLPEADYLERYDIMPNVCMGHHTINGMGINWSVAVRQPVVPAIGGTLSATEITIELAERMGLRKEYQEAMNMAWQIKPEYHMKGERKYSIEEMYDRILKSLCGDEHGLEWIRENGVYAWPKQVEEVYLWPFLGGRIPLYYDFLLDAKENIAGYVKDEHFHWELDDYQPLLEWKPCSEYEITEPGFDLYPIYYTNSVQVDSWQIENSWLDEINRMDPYAYAIEINRATAETKGLHDYDRVRLTTTRGYTGEGYLKLTEGIHPECLGVHSGCYDLKSKYLPIAENKGVAVSNFIPVEPDRLCHITGAYEQCVRVKIEKI
jgi:molybdopterin-containing oxidoreductase family molybdopterin binding subunit